MTKLSWLSETFPVGSLKRQNSRSCLFFYTDGFVLNAAMLKQSGDQLEICASAEKKITAPQQTLQELLTTLRSQQATLPNNAVMLHSRMALGLLELPMASQKSLGDDKLTRIVHWEMETLFAEQAPNWTIGNLLIELNIISEQERDQIISRQKQERQRAASFGGQIPRFGEILIEQGTIDEQELERYLNLQHSLQDEDNGIVSGWYRIDKNILFCSAMSQAEKNRWIAAFAANNLKIERFYPVAGAVAALLKAEKTQCLLEISPSQLVISQLQDGQFQQLEIINMLDNSLQFDDVLAALQEFEHATDDIYLWGNHPRSDALQHQLEQHLGKPLKTDWQTDFVKHPDSDSDPYLMPLLGVARDYFFRNLQRGRLPYVEAMPPPLPWYQNRTARLSMAAGGIILVLVGSDVYQHRQLHFHQQKLEKLKQDIKFRKKQNTKMKRENRRYARLDKQLTQLQEDFKKLQQKKQAIKTHLIDRQKFMRAFLPLLSHSINEDIVLDNVVEADWFQFRIDGWTLNLAALDSFVQKLTPQLEPFNVIFKETPSSQLIKQGKRAGAYQFEFSLVLKPKAAP